MAFVRADEAPTGPPLPSPTLTNPDMILPYVDLAGHAPPSPISLSERPPSPSQLLGLSNPHVRLFQLADAPFARKTAFLNESPAATARPPFGALSDIAEVDTSSPHRNSRSADFDPASPVLDGGSPSTLRAQWRPGVERRPSDESSSINSEEIEDAIWPDFDQNRVGSGGNDAKDHEQVRMVPLPKVAGEDEDLESMQFPDERTEDEAQPYSHAALSRRAEMILENAKRRLTLMEDNLRGARHSLLLSPGLPLNSTSEYTLAGVRDRKSHSFLGFSGLAQQLESEAPSDGLNQGHARVFSESSIVSPMEVAAQANADGVEPRAASALGDFGRHRSLLDAQTLARVQAIRGSRSQDAMRDSRLSSWGLTHDHPLPERSAEAKAGPTTPLEPLPENEAPSEGMSSSQQRSQNGLTRSQSTTVDLRAQMKDLKGRISSLQQRARQDGLKRRSQQSLRSSTSFGAVESWYTGASAYKAGAYGTDAGVGWSPASSTGPSGQEENGVRHKVPSHGRNGSGDRRADLDENHREDGDSVRGCRVPGALVDESEDGRCEERGSGSDESPAENGSVYEEAEDHFPRPPVTERHEDRIDAFDYEHFFLHSAMGSYSQHARTASFSSTDSGETTKPASPHRPPDSGEEVAAPDPRPSPHHRQSSIDSISTLATFATATEGNAVGEEQEEDDDDDGEDAAAKDGQHDGFGPDWPITAYSPGLQVSPPLPRPTTAATVEGQRFDSAVDVRTTNTATGPGTHTAAPPSYPSPPSSSSLSPRSDQTSKRHRPVSTVISTLLSQNEAGGVGRANGTGPKMMLADRDKALVYGLAESLRRVCLNLQETGDDGSGSGSGSGSSSGEDAAVWRRRLDEARKVLDGER